MNLKGSDTKIILLTDSFPSANGGGISQTLFNLLHPLRRQVMVMTDKRENNLVEENSMPTIFYELKTWGPANGRVEAMLNRLWPSRQFEWVQSHAEIFTKKLPSKEKLLILVSTTVTLKLQIAWCLMKLGYKVVPYFMDDWLAGVKLQWKNGNIQRVACELLSEAPGWLVISENLKKTFKVRYHLKEKPCLVIHNPSPAVNTTELNCVGMEPGYCIIYAGSIWPMHYDALLATARAISKLHSEVNINYRLLIYTPAWMWNKHKKTMCLPGIEYGGYIAYNDLQPRLRRGWLLLCTASFIEEQAAFSHSSTQTKLTDYMASGRPVLYVGPPGGASGIFVEEADCGFTVGTDNLNSIADHIETITMMQDLWTRKSANALKLAESVYSQQAVQRKLYQFLGKMLNQETEKSQ
ncbi:MAG: glycosyltransferase family 4 protein [Bacteroidota bacterium]